MLVLAQLTPKRVRLPSGLAERHVLRTAPERRIRVSRVGKDRQDGQHGPGRRSGRDQ